jgi:hypothetical protein
MDSMDRDSERTREFIKDATPNLMKAGPDIHTMDKIGRALLWCLIERRSLCIAMNTTGSFKCKREILGEESSNRLLTGFNLLCQVGYGLLEYIRKSRF